MTNQNKMAAARVKGRIAQLNGNTPTPSMSKAPSRRQASLVKYETDVIEAWLAGATYTQIAIEQRMSIGDIQSILRRYRTEQLEANQDTKEQLAIDQIARIRQLIQDYYTMLGEEMPISTRLKVMNDIRKAEHDISELQGLTRGTVINNIKEIKHYDFDAGMFPSQSPKEEEIVEATHIMLPDGSSVEKA